MQTMVEFLKQEYIKRGDCLPSGVFEQAKEMEKQQIIDAYWGGLNGSINDYSIAKEVGSEIIDIIYGKGAEQYYNETYGSKGSDEYTEINWGGVIQKIPIETNGNNVEKVPNVTSSQTEISDEEIEKESVEYSTNTETKKFYKDCCWDFQNGARWYREQLKQR